MKVRVSYTVDISNEDWFHLAVYEHGKVTRDDIKTTLQHLGEMGLTEQVAEGERIAQARLKDDQTREVE